MKSIPIGSSPLTSSRLAYGCWRIAGNGTPKDLETGKAAVLAAHDAGYTLFDHANIYGGGHCESLFGQILQDTPSLKASLLIATKCGIRMVDDPAPGAPFRYDFSAEHIHASCDQSLKRLGIDTIDLYQLHRPDFLMHPEEVAAAFDQLKRDGKVREFGVSNFRPSQVTALQRACPMKLQVNQVEISLENRTCLTDGTLDQCLTEGITPMAWSPLAGGKLGDGGKDLLPWQEQYHPESYLHVVDAVAKQTGSSRMVVALAWLLKHPAGIVPIVGSTNPVRVRQATAAAALDLPRETWYELLKAAMGEPLP
jgi:predicted oxidoreductase